MGGVSRKARSIYLQCILNAPDGLLLNQIGDSIAVLGGDEGNAIKIDKEQTESLIEYLTMCLDRMDYDNQT